MTEEIRQGGNGKCDRTILQPGTKHTTLEEVSQPKVSTALAMIEETRARPCLRVC